MQPSDGSITFQGSIRVLMNLIRPISMCISVEPPTLPDITARHDDQQVTSFYLPKDTTKVIHISRYEYHTSLFDTLVLVVFMVIGKTHTHTHNRFTLWSIKKCDTFIFSKTLANIDGFS